VSEYHLDYETFSETDIKFGPYKYAEDPTAEIMLCSISKEDDPVYLWINPLYETPENFSDPKADELMDEAFSSPDAVLIAHNSQFENALTRHALKRSWRAWRRRPKNTQWRCTAAMARRAGLQSSLAKVSAELGLEVQKDRRGKALINFFCKPQKDGSRNMPIDHQEKWSEFCSYCITDTVTEKLVYKALKPFALKGDSLRAFQLDATINDRGVPVNIAALKTANKIIKTEIAKAVKRFRKLTGLNPTQNMKILKWFQDRGYPESNMQAETINEFLNTKPSLDPEPLEALELRARMGFAAVKKVTAMLRCACKDGRVYGTLKFCGANQTGRWSGRLIQPQNFKRPSIKRTDIAFSLLEAGVSPEDFALLYDNPLEVIASCIRHFISFPGNAFDGDYSGVEARIVCWLADDTDGLDEFRAFDAGIGEEPYCIMGRRVFGRTITKDDSFERFIGKQIVLGCGFGMGPDKFKSTCENYGQVIETELAERSVEAFREVRKPVKDLWYSVDRAAQKAILSPGSVHKAGKIAFTMLTVSGIPMLIMKLPSSRVLTYLYPKLTEKTVKRAGKKPFKATEISFYGPLPGKDEVYGRVSTYGGKLVENATQGTAYDLMAYGACNAEENGYQICMLVHDQALSERRNEQQSVKEFCKVISRLPQWAEGMPLKAEGHEVKYYTKT
jgi:DNA polymerase bacteriophage-type